MELQSKLNQVFREVFEDEDIQITTETTANDIDGWDSLSHVNLIVTIETKFGINFSQKELLTLRNVGDLLRIIREKMSAGYK